MPSFNHFDLSLPNPEFNSPLVDVVNELEHLRRLQLGGTTPAPLFFQLKHVFHILESLGSARIEGNHTTLADYIENKLEGSESNTDHLQEISNIEKAMDFIENTLSPNDFISESFIKELHAMTVGNLDVKREGDDTPGAYRTKPVRISQSLHLPPEHISVSGYMQNLVQFINKQDAPKYDLIKVAVSHHRFGWIHPFSNGNGRVVRLLTYAMLIKYGFNVQAGGRVLNPTAIFCNDREKYYEMLSVADNGSANNIEEWCIYVLSGILEELRKVDRLTDFSYLKEKILSPALTYAKKRELITSIEEKILAVTLNVSISKMADFAKENKSLSSSQMTYQIGKLVKNGMLRPVKNGARQYTIGFSNTHLLRGIIQALTSEGFISASLVASNFRTNNSSK